MKKSVLFVLILLMAASFSFANGQQAGSDEKVIGFIPSDHE